MTTVKVSVSELRRNLARAGVEILGTLDTEIRKGIAREAMIVLPIRSPVGSPPAATRRGTSVHPGKFRGSWLVSVGTPEFASLPDRPFYAIPGPMDAERETANLKPGQPLAITDDAKTDRADESYAAIMWEGRRMGSHGRMIGSKQAPEGLQKPLDAHLNAQRARIESRAAAKADAAGARAIKGGGP